MTKDSNMRRFLVICMVGVVPFSAVMAQAPDRYLQNTGWDVVQNCVGDIPSLPLPRDQWDFDGVIFTDGTDGVRAIRPDVATSYFVAFNGESSFASAGAFSPDGQWFAYPIGVTQRYANSLGHNAYGVHAIRVVSTGPVQSAYQIPWRDFAMGTDPSRALNSPEWVSNDQFVAYGGKGGVVSALTREVAPWENEVSLWYLSHFSPDFTRAIYFDHWEKMAGVYDIENDTLLVTWSPSTLYFPSVAWKPDASGFVWVMSGEADGIGSTPHEFRWFDRNGQLIDTVISIPDFVSARPIFSPDGGRLAFISDQQGLFVADFTQKQIIDYCLSDRLSYWSSVVWSPDGNTLIFDHFNMTTYSYVNYPVLLNTKTLEMTMLDYPIGTLMGWYPLPPNEPG